MSERERPKIHRIDSLYCRPTMFIFGRLITHTHTHTHTHARIYVCVCVCVCVCVEVNIRRMAGEAGVVYIEKSNNKIHLYPVPL